MKHFCVDLKVCEGWGGLWLRAQDRIQNHGVYAGSCALLLVSEFPAPRGRSRAGRKRKLRLAVVQGERSDGGTRLKTARSQTERTEITAKRTRRWGPKCGRQYVDRDWCTFRAKCWQRSFARRQPAAMAIPRPGPCRRTVCSPRPGCTQPRRRRPHRGRPASSAGVELPSTASTPKRCFAATLRIVYEAGRRPRHRPRDVSRRHAPTTSRWKPSRMESSSASTSSGAWQSFGKRPAPHPAHRPPGLYPRGGCPAARPAHSRPVS